MRHSYAAAGVVRVRALPNAMGRGMLPVIALAGGLLATPFVLHGPRLRAALETVVTLSALSAAWLIRRRAVATRQPRDLILTCVLLTMALVELVTLAPAVLALPDADDFAAVGLVGWLFVAAGFLALALAMEGRPIGRPNDQTGRVALGVAVVSVLCAGLMGVALAHRLVASGTDPQQGLGAALHHPLAALIAVVAASFLIGAVVALAAPGDGDIQAQYRELAAPLVLLAGAQIAFFEIPDVPPAWYSTAEVLRLGSVLLILRWCVHRDRDARAALARAAALAERQRVARDLHDGIAQDLAFIAAHGTRIRAELGDTHPIVIAARRALAHSRGAISDLRAPAATTTAEALELIASELGARFELDVTVAVDLERELAPPVREDTGRIVAEAMANAARHGGAQHVAISLTQAEDQVSLRVADDGCGIGGAPEGFGLASIRERATANGGSMHVRALPSGGTEVEVKLP